MKFKLTILNIFFAWILFALFSSECFCHAPHPFDRIDQDPILYKQLKQIVHHAIKKNFNKPATLLKLKDPIWQSSIPIFITVKKGNKILGCMGSLQSQEDNLVEEITANLSKAFAQDPRHRPISWEEVPGIKIYLTAVGEARAVPSLKFISPIHDGVLIKNNSREAVILPGETKTQAFLEKLARAKSGLKLGESFQVFRLPTKIILVEIDL